jgi:hypothetical protein
LAYSFDGTVGNAGTYSFDLADFGIPSALAAVNAATVQAGAVVGTPLSGPGSKSVTLASGPVSLVVFAQPGPSGGLFGIDLTPAGGGTAAFETTQGVGQLFAKRQVSVTSAGSYAVNVSDVGFPAPLQTFAAIITRGTSQIGSVFGAGAFAFQATTGNYFVNFIAQPGADDQAGTYSLSVAAGPTVTLQSDATSVPSGGTVHLTWSSQNAAACTASDGWSGTQLLSGTAVSSAITTSTTFTLTCSGEGVTAAQSVTVGIDPPKKGGGGGTLSADLLALLGAVVLLQCVRRARRDWEVWHA